MIIFNGWGGITGLIGAGLIAAGLNAALGVTWLSWLIAGISLFAFGWWINNHSDIKQRHGLFWIPIQWWGIAVAIAGFFMPAGS